MKDILFKELLPIPPPAPELMELLLPFILILPLLLLPLLLLLPARVFGLPPLLLLPPRIPAPLPEPLRTRELLRDELRDVVDADLLLLVRPNVVSGVKAQTTPS